MNISVTTKNETNFYPDAFGNHDLPEDKRFTVVLKKSVNLFEEKKWISVEDKKVKVDQELYLRDFIIKFINPWNLTVDEVTNKSEKLTIDILLSQKYPELAPVLQQLIGKVGDLDKDKTEKVKKQ